MKEGGIYNKMGNLDNMANISAGGANETYPDF